jgi:hypothetical protein
MQKYAGSDASRLRCCNGVLRLRKPWKQEFVKVIIEFDKQGRVVAITYTPFPAEHKDALLERVRDVCQSFGRDLTGTLVNVVVGFKSPNRN